jgi:acetyl esterase/lipase
MLSLFLFLISLLTVFSAPAKPLWYVAIAVTEWGHYLAIGSLVLMVLSRRSRAASGLALASALLFLSPLVRAWFLARQLPAQLETRFGAVTPREGFHAPARARPLNFLNLFTGVPSPSVRVTTRIYATVQGQALSLDLYQPLRFDQSLPGVIVIHGGSWQSGGRGELSGLNRYLAARGYLVASIDYRLVPGAVFPAQREDVFTAIAYLKAHAAEIGLNKDQLVLLGRSAGGQIALSAAYAQKDIAIKGVIAFYAPSDLVWGYANPSNPLIMDSCKVLSTYFGGTPAQISGAYEAASPGRCVDKKTPPTLLIHGSRDELVSPLHEERLIPRLQEAGVKFFYLHLPWATHGGDANFSGPSGQLSTYVIERFLAAVMPAGSEERVVRHRESSDRFYEAPLS